MARAGSGAIACGIRERWHVDKRPYPQSALGGSDSTRPAWGVRFDRSSLPPSQRGLDVIFLIGRMAAIQTRPHLT
jgi:hypothetical protein